MADSPPRFITPEGFARIRAEYDELFGVERPKLVEIVSWAASLGDRSENADYHLRQEAPARDRPPASHLARIMKAAKVVDPASQAVARPGPLRRHRRARRRRRQPPHADHRRRRRSRRVRGPDRLERAARPRADRREGRRRAHRPPARRREKLRSDRRSATRAARRRVGALTSCGGSAGIAFAQASAIASRRRAPPAAHRRRRSSATATSACRYWRAGRSSARW